MRQLYCRMAKTRRVARTSQQGAENNPPLPPQTLAEVLAQQTQILQMLAQNQIQQQHPQGRQGQPQLASYSEFVGTHPPIFAKTDDPLEADSWLRLMESKFELLMCTEEQKTLFAAHQLRGPAASWWETFLAMQPTGHRVPWTEFRAAFTAHHIPSSVVKIKLREFMNLKQEDRTVQEYVQIFNALARYAPDHVDTDAKKKECFLEGMSPKLRSRLGRRFEDFNQLVDDAIAMEEDLRLHHLEKRKAKIIAEHPGSAPQRPRLNYQQMMVRPVQQQNVQRPQYYRPPQSQWNAIAPAPSQAQPSRYPCYNCREIGHFVRNCPYPQRIAPMQTPAKGQDSNQAPKKKKKKRTIQTGRVNQLQITEAPTGIPIMTGMFFAHGYPDIVLFDSGASHSFISSLFYSPKQSERSRA